ncbi:MAG: hypothetical protein N3D85_03670 [Candidatus Bathyarchaeota archaeon]|nr:hypothetical protein [Candidatus Bathyarchaeota archaeon]
MIEKKVSSRRKTFVAREDLMNSLSDIAKQRGHSLYETVNELFELAIEAQNMGLNLKRIVEERALTELARKRGFILALETLWYEMADVAFEEKKRQALKSWSEAGAWFAKRYTTSTVADPLLAFKTDLAFFTWNASELYLEKKGSAVSVRVLSPRFTSSYTYLFASFLEGALQAFGYKITSSEVTKGSIRLQAVRSEST